MDFRKLIISEMKNLTSDEFKVFYAVANTMNLNKCNRIPIRRHIIAELCGWWNEDYPKRSLKKVTRVADGIVEKGLIKRDKIFSKDGTSITFYTIPMLSFFKDVNTDNTLNEKKVNKEVNLVEEKCTKNGSLNIINTTNTKNTSYTTNNSNSTYRSNNSNTTTKVKPKSSTLTEEEIAIAYEMARE